MSWRLVKRLMLGGGLVAAAGLGLGLIFLGVNGYRLLSVQSSSMMPTLHKGDLVVVHRVPVKQLASGDVITFVSPHNPKQTITHRVVAAPGAKGQLTTKGDANQAADQPILDSAVLGRVIGHLPWLGHSVDLVRQPLGLACIIYLPALLILIDEWRRLKRYFERSNRVYRLYGWRPMAKRSTGRQLASGAKLTVLCLLVVSLVALPVRAALGSEASLTGISLSTANLSSHMLISLVEFHCSNHNTLELNKDLTVTLYNPTATRLNIDGWYVESSAGRILTIVRNSLRSHGTYHRLLHPANGLHYSGDFLALYNKQGQLIDAISWGSVTTFLNPPLPVLSGNVTTIFERQNPTQDTDSALDWLAETN